MTSNEAIALRPFEERDWDRVWTIMRAVVAAGETYVYERDMSERAARATWLLQPPGLTFVAVDSQDRVLGTAKVGPNQAGPGAHVSTASFMVADDARNRGVGTALARHALQWARDEGFLAMQFNAVVETNLPAVALWRRLGFAIVGTVPAAFDHPRHGLVGLHVMHRFLDGE